MEQFQPPIDVRHRVECIVDRRSTEWCSVTGGGYTAALRLVVRFENGSSRFVKVATSPDTAQWLLTERDVYEHLSGSSFLPEYFGFDAGADGELPILILEDLSAAIWQPPWTTARIDAVLQTLAEVRNAVSRAPSDLPRLEDLAGDYASWHRVAETPEPFLSLNLCSRDWLNAALSTLIAAEAAAPLVGNELVHVDVRSDNICFRADGSAVLVDWNWACRGNGVMDIAGWLPSLQVEGGPAPETILPDHPECAAILSGFWAFRAGLPAPSGAPRVRVIQRAQLACALSWAVRSLGLPPIGD